MLHLTQSFTFRGATRTLEMAPQSREEEKKHVVIVIKQEEKDGDMINNTPDAADGRVAGGIDGFGIYLDSVPDAVPDADMLDAGPVDMLIDTDDPDATVPDYKNLPPEKRPSLLQQAIQPKEDTTLTAPAVSHENSPWRRTLVDLSMSDFIKTTGWQSESFRLVGGKLYRGKWT